jgi:DNA polymerase-4
LDLGACYLEFDFYEIHMVYFQKQSPTVLGFNTGSPTVMHIDINSCFATIEQQANPLLRNKPVAVAAYDTPNGCILAASYEAKRWGVQGVETGMRVKDGKKLCPDLIVLSPDPWKYRNVHLAFRKLLGSYTNDFHAKSIDEFVMHLSGSPLLKKSSMEKIGKEIKARIAEEIGDYLKVSIGISTNRFLAKTASNLEKPNGLSSITLDNHEEIFKRYDSTFLCGIKKNNARRLQRVGIKTIHDFYKADLWQLRAALHSINSYYWYLRLRGWEIDETPFGRKTYGNSYSLPQPFSTPEALAPILSKLTTKTTTRMRKAGFGARGVHIAIQYRDGNYWHMGQSFPRVLFETNDIYKEAFRILCLSPYTSPVRNLAISCYDLVSIDKLQLELFSDIQRKDRAAKAMDMVNKRYGEFSLTSGRMIDTGKFIPDRIAFGNVKELEEFTTQSV